MPLDTPTRTELVSSTKTDVQRELATSNPFLRNSFLGAIVKAFALRIFDFYLMLQEALKQTFWNTSTGQRLEDQAAWFGITRNPATQSTGNVVATGTVSTSIPAGSVLSSSGGVQYISQTTVAIAAQSILISSITRVGSIATATTPSDHGLAPNVPLTVSGAAETDYNVTDAEITITGADTFTYTVANAPTTPATGTILGAFDAAVVDVESDTFGQTTNQVLGTLLTFNTPIAGVDSDAGVDFAELSGGTDQESDADLRTRFLDRVQNPFALFNTTSIIAQAKEVPGVTRVFVEEITPAVGDVTVYFTRDNDASPIPSAGEVTTVKNKLLEIKPAHVDPADLIVAAPTAVATAFTFSALSPNTSTMQTAISANLAAFFTEETIVGVDVTEDAYRSAIFNTIDTETGDRVASFTLSSPSGDITIASGELATLGAISYP